MKTTLSGTVERVVFASDDSPYIVARFRLEGVENQRTYDDLTTIVGNIGAVSPGETLRVGGDWEKHPRHGRHFRVQWCERRLPSTAMGIQRFLGSGIIKGIGPRTAEQIVDCFGEETVEVLETSPERLREVPRLSRKRAAIIVAGWHDNHQIRDVMLFLQSHDLPIHLAKRLRDQYGDECVAVLQRDPYRLVQEVYGVGFRTADAIAVKLGLPPIATSRFVAGLSHVLDEASREGHVYLPREILMQRAAGLLTVDADQLEPGLLEATRVGLVVEKEDRVYRSRYFYAERGAVARIRAIQSTPSFVGEKQRLDPESAAATVATSLGITLADRQIDAVALALREKVSVLTGGPGTGKTMCLHALITVLDRSNIPYSLCAPTGRAAKRMTAATGRVASTIHRLLGFQPAHNTFEFNRDNQLEPRFLIMDEVSMVDLLLFTSVLDALSDDSHLLLVGDSDQLPAIGAGNVLADLLASEAVPAVELDELFRQTEGSAINVAAQQIRRGFVPTVETGNDLYLVAVSNAQRAQEMIEELVVRRIPTRFGLDPKLDVQVLSPMHKGPAGVVALNEGLQNLLNPLEPENTVALRGFRRGDKVMQIRNNYDREVFNGDVGLISGIDPRESVVTVRFGEGGQDFRDVDYAIDDLDELMLAYAVSIHKAQGSEFACVIFPLLSSHYALLQRNLVYTALTRAKQLCIVVHQPKALSLAVSAQRRDQRFTHMAELLQSSPDDPETIVELSLEPLEE